jgi:hypothetical protein
MQEVTHSGQSFAHASLLNCAVAAVVALLFPQPDFGGISHNSAGCVVPGECCVGQGPSARLPAGTLGGSGPIPRNPFSVISQGTNYRGATTRIIGMVFEICRKQHIPSEIIPRPAKLTLRIIPMWPTIATTIALVTPSQLKHSPSITL